MSSNSIRLEANKSKVNKFFFAFFHFNHFIGQSDNHPQYTGVNIVYIYLPIHYSSFQIVLGFY